MVWCGTKSLKNYIKIIGILALIVLSVMVTGGKKVYGKSNISAVSVYLENRNIDKNLKEPVYRIKNRTEKNIKIKKAVIEKNTQGQWIELQRKEGVSVKRNIKIEAGKRAYDSILLNEVYSIPENGLESGIYRICITYRLDGKVYAQYRQFIIVNSGQTSVNNAETACKEISGSADGRGSTIKYSETANILLNSDFNIDKKGNVKAVVFSENNYKTAKKTKIRITIQKKKKGKWVKYKQYKVVKKSNIAYANKKFKVKKSGIYRMKVDIIVYGKNKNYKKRTYRSFEQKYVKG